MNTIVRASRLSRRQGIAAQMGWGVLLLLGGLWRIVALLVFVIYDPICIYLGPRPTLKSRNGVVKLSECLFGACAFPKEMHVNSDGRELLPADPVLDIHVSNPKLLFRCIWKREHWYTVLRTEFESLAPALQNCPARAIVGVAVLGRQFRYPGVEFFPLPSSWYATFATFYMRWIILCGLRGFKRALKERQSVTRLVLFKEDFPSCRQAAP